MRGMTFYIYTLGCKVNTYESEMMQEKLLKHGYVYDKESPDIIIVNTCTVTNVADHKSKEMVARFRARHKDAILIVCGCSSENQNTLYQTMGIDILLGNKDKSQIVELIEDYQKNHQPITIFNETRELPFEDMEVEKFTTHTRAFVKIQDGCNNFCSYCIIPFVRGVPRSKDFDVALKEMESLVNNGHQEIVLTGIHTGSYGLGTPYDLTDLIHEASKLENLKRIRISSIEVTELNEKFMEELRHNPKICNHFHIPLQAGSDEVLKKMNRKYDLKYFEDKLKEIREIRPDVSITTDIIVGHPYETNELFEETVKNASKFAFSKIHVFPFSKRDGTVSAKAPEEVQVSDVEKKRRSHVLCELSKELEVSYAKKFIRKDLEVLIEKSGEVSTGLTSNYLRVSVKEKIPNNTMVSVHITENNGKELIGEVLEKISLG